jgi:hypothetical protein
LPSAFSERTHPQGVPKGLGLAVEFSKDETHNRYALQDLVLQMIEPLYLHFPTRFLVAILHLWKFTPHGVGMIHDASKIFHIATNNKKPLQSRAATMSKSR